MVQMAPEGMARMVGPTGTMIIATDHNEERMPRGVIVFHEAVGKPMAIDRNIKT